MKKFFYVILHSITDVLGQYKPMYRSFNYFIWTKVTKDEEFKIFFDKRGLKDENCPSDELLNNFDARLKVKRRLLDPKKSGNDNKPTELMFFDSHKLPGFFHVLATGPFFKKSWGRGSDYSGFHL